MTPESSLANCPEFSPSPAHASICVCQKHWNDHTFVARRLFFDHSDAARMAATISACKKDNEKPCHTFVPSSDWGPGAKVPHCTCGRPAIGGHPSPAVLAGIRKWRQDQHDRKQAQTACGQYWGSITTPGTCHCGKKWIEHRVKPLVVEAFLDLHQPNCKCVIQNGDVPCTCMTDQEKQQKLDNLAAKKEEKTAMSCRQFKSKSSGHTHCECGFPFYQHSRAACNGHTTWFEWRADNLSDKDLLEWFMGLPGKNRQDRITALRTSLSNPNWKHAPGQGKVNPSPRVRAALMDALCGEHNIKSPKDLEKLHGSQTSVAVIHEDDLPLNVKDVTDRKHFCHSCHENKSDIQGQMCSECSDWLDQCAARTVANQKPSDADASESPENGG